MPERSGIASARGVALKERAVTQDSPGATKGSGKLPGFDTGVANAARMWNYWIGGKDNFRADRAAGGEGLEGMADLAPGNSLVIAHAPSDIEAGTAAAMAQSYNGTSSLTITPRDRATVARFFDGMEMTGPGLLPLAPW